MVSPLGNPAMPMKMPFGPDNFQGIDWPMPNLIKSNVPGFESLATDMMKKTFKNKGVATIEEVVTVTGETPLIELTSNRIGGTLGTQEFTAVVRARLAAALGTG
jgi:hypothetical protein